MKYKSGGGGERKILCYLIGKPPSLNNSFKKSVSREVKTMWLWLRSASTWTRNNFLMSIVLEMNSSFFWLLKSFARSRSVFLELILTVFLLDFLWSQILSLFYVDNWMIFDAWWKFCARIVSFRCNSWCKNLLWKLVHGKSIWFCLQSVTCS